MDYAHKMSGIDILVSIPVFEGDKTVSQSPDQTKVQTEQTH